DHDHAATSVLEHFLPTGDHRLHVSEICRALLRPRERGPPLATKLGEEFEGGWRLELGKVIPETLLKILRADYVLAERPWIAFQKVMEYPVAKHVRPQIADALNSVGRRG